MATSMKVIDPHVHLFNLEQGNYAWLQEDNEPYWPDKSLIHKNFTPSDLKLSPSLELAGIVHIEAGFDNHQPWREIQWLEQYWQETQCVLPLKTIAFIDICLATDEFDHHVEQLKQFQSVVGCRYILDEKAGQLLQHHQVIRNLEVLYELDWLFELHVSLNDMQTLHHIVNFCSELKTPRMIINHCGFPPPIEHVEQWHLWRHHIEQLSQFDHLAIKCSGWEMTDRAYDVNWISSCLYSIIQAFGADRVMLASNFPLTLFSADYQTLWEQYTTLDGITDETKAQLCFHTATKWYGF